MKTRRIISLLLAVVLGAQLASVPALAVEEIAHEAASTADVQAEGSADVSAETEPETDPADEEETSEAAEVEDTSGATEPETDPADEEDISGATEPETDPADEEDISGATEPETDPADEEDISGATEPETDPADEEDISGATEPETDPADEEMADSSDLAVESSEPMQEEAIDPATSAQPEPEAVEEEILTTESIEELPDTLAISIPKPIKTLTIYYDDRFTFTSAVATIYTSTDKSLPYHMTVTSKRCGSSAPDTAVVRKDPLNSKRIIGCGCGSVVVQLTNGNAYQIVVKAAPISLLLIAGQSNGEGRLGDSGTSLNTYKKQAVVNPMGTVYSTYAPSRTNLYTTAGCYNRTGPVLSTSNASSFIPSSMTDNSASDTWKRLDNLTYTGSGKTGIDSSLAYRWHQITGEKVWIVNAAASGSSITEWLPGSGKSNTLFWRAVTLYQAAEALLNKEIAAGHYTLKHKGYFWFQGEADGRDDMKASTYLKHFDTMNRAFTSQMSGSGYTYVKKAIEFCGILMVRSGLNNSGAVTTADLEVTGARQALFTIAQSTSSRFNKVYMASDLADLWTSSTAVKNYFLKVYGSTANYRKQNPTRTTINMPTTMNQVHPDIHYTQLAHNESGRDAAASICYALGYAKAPVSTASVNLYIKDGARPLAGQQLAVKSKSANALIAKVFPVYYSNSIRWNNATGASYSAGNLSTYSSAAKGRLIATVKGGRSAYVTIVSGNKPSTPGLQSVKATSSGGVKITWSGTYAWIYQIYRKVAGGSWTQIATVSGSLKSYTDTARQKGKLYYYTVKGVNVNGSSSYNKTGRCVSSVPGTVTLTGISKSSGKNVIKWSTANYAAGYYIYRKTPGGAWKQIGKVTKGSTTSYKDKKSKKGTTYYYTVRAYNSSGRGGYNKTGLKSK